MRIDKGNLVFGCEVYDNGRTWGHKGNVAHKDDLTKVLAVHKITYHNRTWERYQFETLLLCLIDKLDENKTVPLKDRIEAYNLITQSGK